MAEILGLGVTHFPPLAGRDDDMARILQRDDQYENFTEDVWNRWPGWSSARP